MLQRLDHLSRTHLAMPMWRAVSLVLVLAVAGLVAGLLFPKWTAEALMETPGVATPFEEPQRERTGDAEPKVKTEYVTLAEYRKMIAAYASQPALREYLTAAKKQGAAADRLLSLADGNKFWNLVATPVLPFNRRDAREFGELKDASSNSLVGVDLVTSARTPALAGEMLGTIAGYFRNALLRERIRAWIIKSSGDAPAKQKALRAEIVDAQMRIDTMGRRIQDFKAILSRYPDSAKLDARQVINITEASDRFLSPLAQLVAAEASISRHKETIAAKERQSQQLDLQIRFFGEAEKALRSAYLVNDLIPALAALVNRKFEGVDPEAEWAREVTFRIQADIASFASAFSSFGIRNEARITEDGFRDPVQLGFLGAAAGVGLLALLAFLRVMRTARGEP